jgi:hypothetical protein
LTIEGFLASWGLAQGKPHFPIVHHDAAAAKSRPAPGT